MPNFSHPDEAEIIQILNHARSKAIADLRDLNVPQFAFETNKCDVNISSCDFDFGVHSPQINNEEREEIDFTDGKHTCLSTVSNIQLKNYAVNKNINENCLPVDSPYVKITLNPEKKIVVRKTSLCWFYTKEKYELSSDRLKRVASKCNSN